MLDRAKAAQVFQIGDIDMPVVDLVAALPQEIADHVLARTLGTAGRGNCNKIPRGGELRVETGVDGIEYPLPGIDSVHGVMVPVVRRLAKAARPDQITLCPILQTFWIAMRIAGRSIQWGEFAIATETSDARQPQHLVSHYRRADRRGGRARLQSLPDQEGTGGPADQCRPERTEDPEQVRQGAAAIVKASHIKCFLL